MWPCSSLASSRRRRSWPESGRISTPSSSLPSTSCKKAWKSRSPRKNCSRTTTQLLRNWPGSSKESAPRVWNSGMTPSQRPSIFTTLSWIESKRRRSPSGLSTILACLLLPVPWRVRLRVRSVLVCLRRLLRKRLLLLRCSANDCK